MSKINAAQFLERLRRREIIVDYEYLLNTLFDVDKLYRSGIFYLTKSVDIRIVRTEKTPYFAVRLKGTILLTYYESGIIDINIDSPNLVSARNKRATCKWLNLFLNTCGHFVSSAKDTWQIRGPHGKELFTKQYRLEVRHISCDKAVPSGFDISDKTKVSVEAILRTNDLITYRGIPMITKKDGLWYIDLRLPGVFSWDRCTNWYRIAFFAWDVYMTVCAPHCRCLRSLAERVPNMYEFYSDKYTAKFFGTELHFQYPMVIDIKKKRVVLPADFQAAEQVLSCLSEKRRRVSAIMCEICRLASLGTELTEAQRSAIIARCCFEKWTNTSILNSAAGFIIMCRYLQIPKAVWMARLRKAILLVEREDALDCYVAQLDAACREELEGAIQVARVNCRFEGCAKPV